MTILVMIFSKTGFHAFVASSLAVLLAGCGAGSIDPATVKTVLVMPFEDATAQKDFGDLADGVAEHISVALGTAKGMTVLASPTAAQYKLRPRVDAEIRQVTKADALLEGDVNIQGENVTVRARLRDTATGKELWQTQTAGKREASFVLAEQVAEQAAAWLKQPLRFKKTTPAPTWQHFLFWLEARKLTPRIDPVDVNLAVYDLEKFRGDYPDYWPARAPAAELFGRLVALEFLTRSKAREWIKGIVYDTRMEEPDSAEAHYAEGALAYYVDWNWAAAEPALKKAIDARPNLVGARHALAQLYVTTNRKELALKTIEEARRIDPLGYETVREHAGMLAANGRFDDALKALAEAEALSKDERTLAILKGLYQFAKGDYEGARVQTGGYATGRNELVAVQALYGATKAKLGDTAEAKRMLDLLASRPKRELTAADPIHLALVHLNMGDAAQAFNELASAVKLHRTLALGLPGNAAFYSVWKDPRYQAVIDQIVAAKPIENFIEPPVSIRSPNQ